MDKITQWTWRKNQEDDPETGAYWFDTDTNELVVKKTIGEVTWEDNRFPAQTIMDAYAARGYEKLQKQSQHVYDYLYARGYRPT